MKRSVEINLNTVRRTLEEKRVNTGVYSTLLLVAILVYGLMGAYPLSKVINRKMETINNLESLNEALAQKEEYLKSTEGQIRTARTYLRDLEEAIPRTTQVERYVGQVADVAAKTGYKQKRLAVEKTGENEVELVVKLQGNETQFNELLLALESMERLTEITRFEYVFREDAGNVTLRVKIFYLET